jgi:hypothetical protein
MDSVDVDVDTMMADAMAETADAPGADASEADAPDAPAAPEGEGPADAGAPDVAAEVPPEPFTFKAFKQDYEVPGLRFDKAKNAIVVDDPRGLDRLRQMLSHGREWEARGRQELVQLRKENTLLREQPVAEIEQAKAYLAEIQQLMEMPVEDLAEWVMQARQHWPVMQAKAERAYAERLMAQAQAAQQPPEPDVEQVVEEARAGAEALVQDILQGQPWANPDIAAELTEFLQDPRTMDQWVLRANRDLPDMGIRAGQYVANWDAVRELVDRMTKPYRRAHEQTATVQQRAAQTTKVAQQNAAALATARKPAPKPAPPAAAKPTPAPTRPQSRAELMSEVWSVWKEQQRQR